MADGPKVGRRAFVGLGLAAAGGLALGGLVVLPARPTVRWLAARGFPDGPQPAEIAVPGATDGAEVTLVLHVETPREALVRDAGRAVVAGGVARVEVALTYPYDARVPGAYRYRLEARCRGRSGLTADDAGYSVRALVPFA